MIYPIWPQIIWIVFYTFCGAATLMKHGEQRTDTTNFGVFLTVAGLQFLLLCAGGFFRSLGWHF